jgi:hypothetical protein
MGLWRNIFGPGQDEVWGGIAREIQADYTPAGWMQRGRIDLQHDGVVMTLDTFTISTGKSSTTYTRMRSPFRNGSHLAMNIYRESIFSGMGRWMGMQDVTIGDAFFDQQFVIQGKPEATIKAFLQDPKLKGLIQSQPDICLKIKPDDGWFSRHYPDGVDELYFQCLGVMKDEARLKHMFELFSVAADKLSELDPGVRFGVNIKPK